MDVEYGACFRIDELKATDGGAWEVTGYASTFGNLDAGGDVVMRGAFDASLTNGRPVRFLHAHRLDQVLGVTKSLTPDDQGLLGTFKISKTSLGEDVHTLLKDGALDSFSIGYVPTEVEFDDSGARLLKSVDLLEVSVVSLPMNDRALVTRVKAEWDAAYINDLPDSAFAVILPGGSKDDSGKTVPRSLRKLPHHKANGDIDLAHLRNALSREPQAGISDEAHATARRHLQRHAKAEGVGEAAKAILELIGIDEEQLPFEDLLAQISGFDKTGADAAEALYARRQTEQRKLSDGHLEAIDHWLADVKATATRFERVLDEHRAAAEAQAGDLKHRLELRRRLHAYAQKESA